MSRNIINQNIHCSDQDFTTIYLKNYNASSPIWSQLYFYVSIYTIENIHLHCVHIDGDKMFTIWKLEMK